MHDSGRSNLIRGTVAGGDVPLMADRHAVTGDQHGGARRLHLATPEVMRELRRRHTRYRWLIAHRDSVCHFRCRL